MSGPSRGASPRRIRQFRPALGEPLETRIVPAVYLSELNVNPPSATDVPYEYVELRGDPNTSLSNLSFVAIEGSVASAVDRGTANVVINLNTRKLGSNGLLIIKSPSGGFTGIPSATTVVTESLLNTLPGGLSNGAQTYMLILSSTPLSVGTDYDSNNDGLLELPSGARIVDSVGWSDSLPDSLVYGGATLTQVSGVPDAATRFPDNDSASSSAAWYNGDLLGTNADSVTYNPAVASANLPAGAVLTPGAANAPTTIEFTSNQYQALESIGTLSIPVARLGVATSTVTVNYTTQSGTAISGVDFIPASGTLTFGPNETIKFVNVPIFNDSLFEGDETFGIALSSPSGNAVLGVDASTTVTIRDNETAPIVNFANSVYSVAEGASQALITVRRTGGGDPFTVQYSATAGNATPGVDFSPVSGTLTFGLDEFVKTFSVPIFGDQVKEGDETVLLSLTNPGNQAVLGPLRDAVLNIRDNETLSVFNFSSLLYTTNENMRSATITVRRTGGSQTPASVSYATLPGTATPGLDYGAVSGTLNFSVGENSKTFTVPIIADPLAEPEETVILTLSNPSADAVLGENQVATLQINDRPLPAGPTVTDVRLSQLHQGINRIQIDFSAALNPQAARNPSNYTILGPGDDRIINTLDDVPVPFVGPFYDAGSRTVTLDPRLGGYLPLGAFFKLIVKGDTLTSAAGTFVDGDRDGTGGGNFEALAAMGNPVTFQDADGDTATITLNRPGFLQVTRAPNGNVLGSRLYMPRTQRNAVLNGSVVQGKLGDGFVRIPFMTGLSRVRSKLPINLIIGRG